VLRFRQKKEETQKNRQNGTKIVKETLFSKGFTNLIYLG
jgi:hypothetical protein